MSENRELALVLRLVADNFQSELKKSGGMLGEFNKFIGDWKTQLVAAGGALFAIAKSTANYGEELVKAGQKMGTSIQDTARLQYAAKLAGTDLQGLTKTIGILSKEMFSASLGNADGKRTFELLGLSATNANGTLKSTTAILVEMSDKFRLMPDGPAKTALAMLALGKSAREVLPLLNSNLREAFADAERFGLVMSDKDARAAEHFNDELKKLQASIRGVTNDLGTALIPKFDALAHALNTVLGDAKAVASALGHIPEQPDIRILQPNDGGRRIRILPPPAGIESAVVTPFFKTEAQAKTEAEQITALNQLQRQAIENKLQLMKTGFERARVIIESGIAEGMMLEVDAATSRARVSQQELEAERADLIAQKELEVKFYAERKTLTFKDDEDRLKIKTEHQKKLADIDQKIAINAAQATTASFKGQAEIAKANANTIREQNELLFAGTDALKADREKQQQFQIDNAQSWVAYYDQLGGNTQDFLTHKTELLRAQLAKELDLTKQQSAELLAAWQQRDSLRADQILANSPKLDVEKETIELNTMRQNILNINAASNDFFGGWVEGMRKYVKDTQSGFGLAADMARRTAQLMESSFKSFFFDVMDGRIQSFKDVLKGLLDFTKQIVSQIASQLVTNQILRGITGAGGSLFDSYALSTHGPVGSVTPAAMGGQVIRRFAMGGPVPGFGNQDSVPALLTPGEVVLSRRDVSDIKGGLGGISFPITVVNQMPGAEIQATPTVGTDGLRGLQIMVVKTVTSALGEGRFDKPLAQRFRMHPQG